MTHIPRLAQVLEVHLLYIDDNIKNNVLPI